MSQQSWIAAALIIGFIVWITMRGELSQYLTILGINTATTNSTSTTAAASSNSLNIPSLPSLA